MPTQPAILKTGVSGLDNILNGGLFANRVYLIEGDPGVGKTTLALQFLLEGVRNGEKCLYVSLSETREELDGVAASHGVDLSGIEIVELSAIEKALKGKANTLFQSADVELNHLSKYLLDEVDRVGPSRLVLDSLSELRLIAQNPLRYRRHILSFKQHFAGKGCTVLMLDDRTGAVDAQVRSIVHGIIALSMVSLKFGINRRFLSVAKLRGAKFREGQHDYSIHRGGLQVFPRLIAAEHHVGFKKILFSSGNKQMDLLLGGGLHTGTSNLFMGPAGSGKTTLASMFAHAAASRGEKVAYYAFDENVHTLLDRAREMHTDFEPLIEAGTLKLTQIDPAEIAPGELADSIVATVEKGTRLVVLDSLNGYVTAMPQEEFLELHLHELLTYLNQQGVITIMVLAQHGLIGPMGAPVDVSYLADTVVLMRFFEALGEVKKAMSVIKKRSGPHETSLRELIMRTDGVSLGEPLREFEGILTGVPRYRGAGL